MSDFIVLEAEKRDVLGKKVKNLRRAGIVPAVVYGPETDPISISIDYRELRHTLREAGGTQIIELHIGKEKIPVLARDVQRHILLGDIEHVDFYKVSLTRAISAEVPVILVNDAPAVATGEGQVIHALSSLLVEALPTDLPQHIEVDLTALAEIGDTILVADLTLPKGVTALTDGEELVAKADYLAVAVEEEAEEGEGLFTDESPEVEVITERREEDEE